MKIQSACHCLTRRALDLPQRIEHPSPIHIFSVIRCEMSCGFIGKRKKKGKKSKKKESVRIKPGNHPRYLMYPLCRSTMSLKFIQISVYHHWCVYLAWDEEEMTDPSAVLSKPSSLLPLRCSSYQSSLLPSISPSACLERPFEICQWPKSTLSSLSTLCSLGLEFEILIS